MLSVRLGAVLLKDEELARDLKYGKKQPLLDHIARTTYVHAVYCYRPSSMVCLSVCHSSEPCKNG